jgi:hypothetical protein
MAVAVDTTYIRRARLAYLVHATTADTTSQSASRANPNCAEVVGRSAARSLVTLTRAGYGGWTDGDDDWSNGGGSFRDAPPASRDWDNDGPRFQERRGRPPARDGRARRQRDAGRFDGGGGGGGRGAPARLRDGGSGGGGRGTGGRGFVAANRCFVANLPYEVNWMDLKDFFKEVRAVPPLPDGGCNLFALTALSA